MYIIFIQLIGLFGGGLFNDNDQSSRIKANAFLAEEQQFGVI